MMQDEALADLREWASEISDETLGPPGIVRTAGEFAPQVTNTAMFLFENHVDIRLVQVRLYRLDTGQLVVTTSQLLPVPNGETFMMRPRSTAATQVAAREGRARRASIPQRLVDSEYLADGTPLQVIVPDNINQDRDAINLWLDAGPRRPEVSWRQDPRRPLYWAEDEETYSFSGLMAAIIDRATHLPPQGDLWGPNWIITADGTPLHKLADQVS